MLHRVRLMLTRASARRSATPSVPTWRIVAPIGRKGLVGLLDIVADEKQCYGVNS